MGMTMTRKLPAAHAAPAALEGGYRTADIMPSGAAGCKKVGCGEMDSLIKDHLTKG